jgi:hypothetical protein
MLSCVRLVECILSFSMFFPLVAVFAMQF